MPAALNLIQISACGAVLHYQKGVFWQKIACGAIFP
jgi:hypothetical protein